LWLQTNCGQEKSWFIAVIKATGDNITTFKFLGSAVLYVLLIITVTIKPDLIGDA
jgi:hypothetical protein